MISPFFSIVIPAYNVVKEYFVQCIKSIIRQTFSDIEIIIVDDGSLEEYVELYDSLAETDFRIKVLHQNNMGVSAARNNGIKNARAEWIMFVDADDWIEQDCCEILYNIVSSNECDIVLFDHVSEFAAGLQKKSKSGLISNTLYNTSDIKVKETFYRRAMGTPNIWNDSLSIIYYSWNKVYSRDFLINNGLLFPEGLPKSEDKVFTLRCFEKMRFLFYTDDALYHYRNNEQSVSNRFSPHVEEERKLLSNYLVEIARRMDSEMALLLHNPSYDIIYHDYNRFVFGIISDILFSKYYHKEYPGTLSQRNKEVKAFLHSEPFRTAINTCTYDELGREAKIKEFMLKHGLSTWLCMTKKVKLYAKGWINQKKDAGAQFLKYRKNEPI